MSISTNDAQASLSNKEGLVWQDVKINVDDIDVVLATVHREGPLSPVLFCHGFGSTKEDYLDASLQKAFDGRAFLAYDTPGSGASTCSDLSKLSMPLLVAIARAISHKIFGSRRFHLVGHSMGGLTGLLLAEQIPQCIISFIDIKGNLAPEDCFLSRQILNSPSEDPKVFLSDFIERTRRTPFYGNGLYAAALRAKVQPEAIRPTFESMVQFSDEGNLLEIFESLKLPRIFMFGEQHASLSYLPRLGKAGVELVEIPQAGHFVMYSNPVAMWDTISRFLPRTENDHPKKGQESITN